MLSAWDVSGDPAWSQELEWEVHRVDAFAGGTLLVSGMSEERLASEEDPLPGFEQELVAADGRVRSVPDDLVDEWSMDGPLVQVVDGTPMLLASPLGGEAVQTWVIAEQSRAAVLARTASHEVVRPGWLHPAVEGP